ncbi:MAG: hypothetical protein R6U66_12175 [Bacteroidales bacterium]
MKEHICTQVRGIAIVLLIAGITLPACQPEAKPGEQIEGHWGLAGMQLDEQRAGESLTIEEQEAMRDQFQAIFNWFDMTRYTVLLIDNGKIIKKRRYNNSVNNDYRNQQVYMTEYASDYSLLERNDSLFIMHEDRYRDTLLRTIYHLSSDSLVLESEHSDMGRHVFTRIP